MSLALALVLVAQTSAAAPAPAPAKQLPPASFEVRADAKGGAAAKAWADELRGFMAARKDEFRAPRPGEKADVVVQVDSVAPAPNGSLMKGALLVGGAPHPFTLSYAGPSAPQTEKLARNLRQYAEQLKSAPPPGPPKK
ncbi:MAG: hypothetical protein U0599_10375 [Vicinamibacteria bacterium]